MPTEAFAERLLIMLLKRRSTIPWLEIVIGTTVCPEDHDSTIFKSFEHFIFRLSTSRQSAHRIVPYRTSSTSSLSGHIFLLMQGCRSQNDRRCAVSSRNGQPRHCTGSWTAYTQSNDDVLPTLPSNDLYRHQPTQFS